ncbi:hypothetical protein Pcinc_001008 [Petrolisthes cinctipes]|uniref:CCHC-type domain-containing protein n=1 Tax=Petrolisthes cinctipes TaxID=88211 RepID=A0AAE1GKX3_PETCI|nr:hypothetical protein Pcinc_001008 [Petrolisthes cinctipes]
MRVFTGEDSVPKFDGDPNKNYTIEEFIRRLEQSFVEYNITEDRGKIGYADSRIEGEFARQLLNCSCLLGRSSREQQTWEEFKKALVIVYRRSAPEGCSAWAHRIFTDLGLKAWTTSLEVAVSKAGAIRKDIQDCIQDNNWSKDVNGEQWMKVDDACEMFEYLLMYLGLSEEDQRRVRKKKLERGKGIWHLINELKLEIRDPMVVRPFRNQNATKVQTPVLQTEVTDRRSEGEPQTGVNAVAGQRNTRGGNSSVRYQVECFHCRKWGHVKADCPQLQNRSQGDQYRGSMNRGQAYPRGAARRARGGQARGRGRAYHYAHQDNYQQGGGYVPPGQSKWCEIHKWSNHITADCGVIIRAMHEEKSRMGVRRSGSDEAL